MRSLAVFLRGLAAPGSAKSTATVFAMSAGFQVPVVGESGSYAEKER